LRESETQRRWHVWQPGAESLLHQLSFAVEEVRYTSYHQRTDITVRMNGFEEAPAFHLYGKRISIALSAARLSRSNVFKGRDGTRYEILTANAREEAKRLARGMDFVLLEVVPRWSFPAREWVDGNREMWKRSKGGDVR
jgi:hypothetical protein